jgi:DnaK suppressor protein
MPVTYGTLRERLQKSASQLREQLADVQAAVREDGVGYSNHMADSGSEVFEQEMDVSVAQGLKIAYEDVQQALEKFEDGTYGICESCGGIIELARLEAIPEARYCMACKSRREMNR